MALGGILIVKVRYLGFQNRSVQFNLTQISCLAQVGYLSLARLAPAVKTRELVSKQYILLSPQVGPGVPVSLPQESLE